MAVKLGKKVGPTSTELLHSPVRSECALAELMCRCEEMISTQFELLLLDDILLKQVFDATYRHLEPTRHAGR